jgi:hypothetical protein
MEGRSVTIAVVTGGRDYSPSKSELDVFVGVLVKYEITVLRHGAANMAANKVRYARGEPPVGVDEIASLYAARALSLRLEAWPAEEWGAWPACGPMRNRAMVLGERGGMNLGRARVVAAFHGGPGTRNCMYVGQANRIKIVKIAAPAQPDLFGDER